MQYALAASQEALDDAGWHPESEHEKELTVNLILSYAYFPNQSHRKQGVCVGSGIGSFGEIYDTSLAFAKGVSPPTQRFTPSFNLTYAIAGC